MDSPDIKTHFKDWNPDIDHPLFDTFRLTLLSPKLEQMNTASEHVVFIANKLKKTVKNEGDDLTDEDLFHTIASLGVYIGTAMAPKSIHGTLPGLISRDMLKWHLKQDEITATPEYMDDCKITQVLKGYKPTVATLPKEEQISLLIAQIADVIDVQKEINPQDLYYALCSLLREFIQKDELTLLISDYLVNNLDRIMESAKMDRMEILKDLLSKQELGSMKDLFGQIDVSNDPVAQKIMSSVQGVLPQGSHIIPMKAGFAIAIPRPQGVSPADEYKQMEKIGDDIKDELKKLMDKGDIPPGSVGLARRGKPDPDNP